jgi:hypothetical protein
LGRQLQVAKVAGMDAQTDPARRAARDGHAAGVGALGSHETLGADRIRAERVVLPEAPVDAEAMAAMVEAVLRERDRRTALAEQWSEASGEPAGLIDACACSEPHPPCACQRAAIQRDLTVALAAVRDRVAVLSTWSSTPRSAPWG